MPLSAPASVKFKARSQGIHPINGSNDPAACDAVLIEITPPTSITAGATYLIYDLQWKYNGTGSFFTTSTNAAGYTLPIGSFPTILAAIPGASSANAFEGGFARPGTNAAVNVTNVQARARDSFGNVSGWTDLSYGDANVNGSGGTLSASQFAIRSAPYPSASTDLEPPVPASAAPAPDLSYVDVGFDYVPTNAFDHTITVGIYDAAGTVLQGSKTEYALKLHGTGRTLRVPCSLAHNTTYRIKISSFARRELFVTPPTYTRVNATTLDFTTSAFGFSPSVQHVVVGQPFSITLTTSDTSAVFSAISLPDGVTLSSKSGTDPQVLSGTISAAGTYIVSMLETIGSDSESVSITLIVGNAISAPDEIAAWKNDELLQIATYQGQGTISNWFLTNAPPGVTIGTITISGDYGDVEAANVIAISGVPSASGVYEAQISVIALVDGVPYQFSAPLRFIISGDLFLGWFHDDPDKHELQLMLRSREVKSFWETSPAVLFLKRNDDEKLYIIVRDGPIAGGEGNYGRLVISDLTELRLVIRPTDNLDAEPYLDLGGTVGDEVTTETIGGNVVFVLAFKVESDALEQVFKALNAAPGAEPLGSQISATGDLRWTRSGRSRSSLYFPVTIAQDEAEG